MGRKVFISILGTGNYELCAYSKGNFVSSTTPFIQRATLEYIKAEEWSANDSVIIFLTDGARKLNWDKELATKPYKGLSFELDQMKLPCKVESPFIPDGKDEREMWTLFTTMYESLKEGDELYIDLTHSFRYIPMLMIILCQYAKLLKNISIKSITYGNNQTKDGHGNALIVDLSPLSTLQDWIFAASDYIEKGNAIKLRKMSDSALLPLLKNPETRSDGVKDLKGATVKLADFLTDLKTCRGLDVISGSKISQLDNLLKSAQIDLIEPLRPLLEAVNEVTSVFDRQSNVLNALRAAKVCFGYEQYQSAITFLEEGIVSYFCEKYGIDIADEYKRDNVNKAINAKYQYNKAKHSGAKLPDLNDLSVTQSRILQDELIQNDDFVNLFVDICGTRNDYNHCGMRSTRQPLSPNKMVSKIESLINKTTVYFNDTEDTPVPDEQNVFINLSNHPSSNWSVEQLTAANSFGEVKDLSFPNVSPAADESDIEELASETIKSLPLNQNLTVHVMGEMTLAFAIVTLLKAKGIRCVASTTERIVTDNPDGTKTATFKFMRFREY